MIARYYANEVMAAAELRDSSKSRDHYAGNCFGNLSGYGTGWVPLWSSLASLACASFDQDPSSFDAVPGVTDHPPVAVALCRFLGRIRMRRLALVYAHKLGPYQRVEAADGVT